MAQVEFRDGSREVPDHLADLMVVFETYKMTYEEARDKANQRLAADLLNKTQQQILNSHFGKRF